MTFCETLKRLFTAPPREALYEAMVAAPVKESLTTDRFPVLVERVFREEGGLADHKKDPGGLTNYGVTQGRFSRWCTSKGLPVESVARITRKEAEAIYREEWEAIQGPQLPVGVDWATFDAAVNSGPARAAKWLQGAVGEKMDGVIGPRTIAATQAVDSVVTIVDLCGARLAFMREAKHKVTGERLWPTFGKGWGARVKRVQAEAIADAKGGA
jgi:lysozyme family protein